MSYDRLLKDIVSLPSINSNTSAVLEVIELLLQKGADPKIKNTRRETLFQIASWNQWNESDYIKLIEIIHATKKFTDASFSDAFCTYFISNSEVNLNIIQAFFQAGAMPTATTYSHETIFGKAANQMSNESYLALIELSVATKRLQPDDFSLAYCHYISYAEKLNVQIIEAFFNAGAIPTTISNKNKGYNDIFFLAVDHFEKDDYIQLIKNKNIDNNTLCGAFKFYFSGTKKLDLEIIRAFIEAGADPETQNSHKKTIANTIMDKGDTAFYSDFNKMLREIALAKAKKEEISVLKNANNSNANGFFALKNSFPDRPTLTRRMSI